MPKIKTVDAPVSEDQDVETSPVSDAVEAEPVGPTFAEVYAFLAAPFDKTFERQIPGGRMLTYITSEQVVSRLNEAQAKFGIAWNWYLDPISAPSGDDVYVSGYISMDLPTTRTYCTNATRAGIGGSKVRRSRSGDIVDLGNDYKAAETAAFKRAASKFGVGLYLYERDESIPPAGGTSYSAPANTGTPRQAPSNLAPVAFPTNNSNGSGTTGIIQAKSANGLNINGQWYNVSKFAPIDLGPYQRGQTVTIAHAPGKTFIDGITVPGTSNEAIEVGAAEDF